MITSVSFNISASKKSEFQKKCEYMKRLIDFFISTQVCPFIYSRRMVSCCISINFVYSGEILERVDE